MEKTKIEWCDSTWNPVTGCLHNCEYCYARGIANRFRERKGYELNEDNTKITFFLDGSPTIYEVSKPCFFERLEDLIPNPDDKIKAPYPYGFSPTFHRYRLNDYIGKQSRNIFVCSVADLFGKWVPDEWIEEVFKACEKAPQHNYLFLTKNVERYCQYGVPLAENMWYGVSITRESEASLFNSLPAGANTFVSMEPLLEDIHVKKHNMLFIQVDWVIIGAETGRRKDKVLTDRKWIEDIVEQCHERGKPVFMKESLIPIIGEENMIREFPFDK